MNSDSQLTLSTPAISASPELELLLACSRTHLDMATIKRVEALTHSDINATELISLATQHRVIPLLHHTIARYVPEILSQPPFDLLPGQCRQISLRNMFLLRGLLDLTAQLKERKIQAVSFKGPLLATTYGDLSLRQISDLDILVLESDFQQAIDYLVSQGYTLKVQVPWEAHLISPSDIYSIDLHRDVVPKHLSCFRDSSELWSHIKSLSVLGKKIDTFTPSILLLILCLNGTKEGWCRLNRICDVAELVRAEPDLDWPALIKLASGLGSKRLLLLGLLLTHNLLGATLPEVVWHQVQVDSAVQSLAMKIQQQIVSGSPMAEPKEVERTLFHISTRERWQDKVRSFLGLMDHSGWLTITDNDRQFLPLPDPLSFLYYLIRPIRILSQYTKYRDS